MANTGNACTIKDGKVVDVSIPSKPEEILNRNIKLPCVVVNGESAVKYYPFVAFGQDAIRLHKSISQGDTIVMLGKMINTTIPGVANTKEVLWVDDVRLIRQSNRKSQQEAHSLDDREELGF